MLGVDLGARLGQGAVRGAERPARPRRRARATTRADDTPSNVQSFIFGGGAEVAEHVGVGLRVPLTFATLQPQRLHQPLDYRGRQHRARGRVRRAHRHGPAPGRRPGRRPAHRAGRRVPAAGVNATAAVGGPERVRPLLALQGRRGRARLRGQRALRAQPPGHHPEGGPASAGCTASASSRTSRSRTWSSHLEHRGRRATSASSSGPCASATGSRSSSSWRSGRWVNVDLCRSRGGQEDHRRCRAPGRAALRARAALCRVHHPFTGPPHGQRSWSTRVRLGFVGGLLTAPTRPSRLAV